MPLRSAHWLGAFLFALCVCRAAHAGEAASGFSLALATLTQGSRLTEYDVSGRPMVQEHGDLQGAQLGMAYRRDDWRWRAGFSDLQGQRDYAGQTSTGVPVNSSSQARPAQWQLEAAWAVHDTVELSAWMQARRMRRAIASAGGAQGYPETYHWTLWGLGAAWHTGWAGGELRFDARLGVDRRAHMLLQLPGRDAADLPLGRLREAALEGSWSTALTPDWRVVLGVERQLLRAERGAPVVITRRGAPVGVARQPAFHLSETLVQLGLVYSF